MKKVALFPFGPMLMVACVPYLQWERFAGDFSLAEAHRAALIFAFVTLGLMAALSWLLRSWRKTGLVATMVAYAAPAGFGVTYPIITFWTLLILTSLIERRIAFEKMAVVGNVLGLAIFLSFFWINRDAFGEQPVLGVAFRQIGEVELTERPSIVHIVLDAYGSTDVLSEIYAHDNGPFRRALEDRGFQILENVVAPYNRTIFVMASIMSGGYVEVPEATANVRNFIRALGNTATKGNVLRALRGADYNFAYTKSGLSGYDLIGAQNVTPQSPFSLTFLERSLIPKQHQFLTFHNRLVRNAFDPENFTDLRPPFFYYQHVLAPHPPFSLTATGDWRQTISRYIADGSHFVRGSAGRRARYIQGYLEKVNYAESALIRQMPAVPLDKPIVIFIHGDHGPGAYLDHENFEKTCAVERMTTFLAVYSNVPEIRDAFAAFKSETFNLANLYRVLFSEITATRFEPLPSVSKFVPFSEPSNAQRFSEISLAGTCGASRTAVSEAPEK